LQKKAETVQEKLRLGRRVGEKNTNEGVKLRSLNTWARRRVIKTKSATAAKKSGNGLEGTRGETFPLGAGEKKRIGAESGVNKRRCQRKETGGQRGEKPRPTLEKEKETLAFSLRRERKRQLEQKNNKGTSSKAPEKRSLN